MRDEKRSMAYIASGLGSIPIGDVAFWGDKLCST